MQATWVVPSKKTNTYTSSTLVLCVYSISILAFTKENLKVIKVY